LLIGIAAGLLTGALWGLTFVAPRAVQPFSEIDLAVARYMIFGVVSLLLMLLPRFRPRRLTRAHLGMGLFLGAMGYVAYYLFAAYAVGLAGPAIPPLVIGALPLALAIVGNRQDRSVPWRSLALPLLLIGAGLAVVNVATLREAQTASARLDIVLGTLCAIGAFGVWMAYGILNANVMRRPDAPDPLVWTGLQGIGSLAATLPLVPLMVVVPSLSQIGSISLVGMEGARFLVWAVLLGVAGSWIATWLWVIASSRLPLALSAQMIVTETVFALIYGFLWEQRWPRLAEALGIALLIAGVVAGIRIFTRAVAANEVVTSGGRGV